MLALPPLYPIVDPAAVPGGDEDPVERAVTLARAVLAGGAKLLQLRMKGGPGGTGTAQVLAAAKAIRRLTRDAGCLFVVNDRVDVALLVDADGVHVGQEDLPCLEARRLVGGQRMVGVSTHTVLEARAAERVGADYIGFGPMFPTATKTNTRPQRSLDRLREVKAAVGIPVVAIGGITADRIARVRGAGADSVAVISAITAADDPEAATRTLGRLAASPPPPA